MLAKGIKTISFSEAETDPQIAIIRFYWGICGVKYRGRVLKSRKATTLIYMVV